MQLKYFLGLLLTAWLIVSAGAAPRVEAQAPPGNRLEVVASGPQEVVLALTVTGFEIETIDHADQTYHRLIIPDMTQTGAPGEPQTPMRGALVGVPTTAGVTLQILEADSELLSGYRLYPAPALTVTGDDPFDRSGQETFTLNQERYATAAFYPDQLAEIGYTGYIRDQAVAQVQFYPAQYNPVSNQIRLYRRLLVRLTWDAPLTTASAEKRSAAPAYETLLRRTLLNYETLDRPPLGQATPALTSLDLSAANVAPRLKIGVTADGMYELKRSDLTDAGFDLTGVALSKIKISNRGAEIPIYTHDDNQDDDFDNEDYILFYGTAITDVYTTKNIYWLESDGAAGRRMAERPGTLSGGAQIPDHFPATLHAEEDSEYWFTMPDGEGEDHWFWGNRFSKTSEKRNYTLALNNISTTAGTTTVRVRLKGFTQVHQTRIYLNDTIIDDQPWNGQISYDHEVTAATSSLPWREKDNVLSVEAVGVVNQFYLNWIEVEYQDRYVAENDELLFGAPEAGTFQFEATNFNNSAVQVFDVTDPANPAVISQPQAAGGGPFKVQFEDTAQAESRYLALTPARRKSPAGIALDEPSTWKDNSNGADYIIITPQDFYNSAITLADHRADSGLRTAVVKVEDIYDEFNDGVFNPQAIRDFLAYAYDNWIGIEKAPTYVLLLGGATYDYRDLLSLSKDNYIPTQVIETDNLGQTPSDNWFVLVEGDDILPDMLIGRLTAQSKGEAANMVNKIIDYEKNPPADPWNKQVLLIADDEPAFTTISDRLAAAVPYYYAVDKIYVEGYPPGDPTVDIIDRINSGSLLVNYSGHGNLERWGEWLDGDNKQVRIFNSANARTLNNPDKLPVVTIANCLNGFFTHPILSMAEEFMRPQAKGAVAVWAAASLDYPSGHRLLMDKFYETIFQEDEYKLGQATTAAKLHAYAQSSFWGELVEAFVFFGDPAMELGLPPNYPYVKSTTPADGVTNIPPDQPIQVVFSKPMNPATVHLSGLGATDLTFATGLTFTPTWNVEQTEVTYDHSGLEAGSILNFTIEGQDNLGNALGSSPVPASWTFVTQTAEPTPPDGVLLTGPATGVVDALYTFEANTQPITATQPLTYEWQATGQSPETHPDASPTDQAAFKWSGAGNQTVTVTVINAHGLVTGVHTITIDKAEQAVYLPLVIKQ